MSNYNLAILFILLVNFIIVESSTDCLENESPETVTCERRGVPDKNKYVCIIDHDGNRCVQLAISQCNEYYYGINNNRRLSGLSCSDFETSDKAKYNCVTRNGYCVEEGKSECLQASIYSMRRRLKTTFDEDYCKGLGTTSNKKRCVLVDDETGCDEVDFSFGLNINKLSLFVFCLLFFL